jgi:thymidylate synthase
VETVLGREPKPLPTLRIIDRDGSLRGGGLDALLRFTSSDSELLGYESHGRAPAPVAV